MRISDWSSDVCSSDLLSGAMQKINAAVQKRLALAGKREALTRKLTDDHDNFLYLAQPAADQAVPDMKSEFGLVAPRSGERRGGNECVRRVTSRWSEYS